MGGKKGPEKNRKYEKDRRDRFNEQFVELHKLLPDFNSSSAKTTKAEIISKTIQYLKDSHSQTQKLEIEFENEKVKVSELQKKVNGVLQIVKELIKLLHKSNIRFPSSLPVDDFKTFQDVFDKSKKELTLVSTGRTNTNDADLESSSDSEAEEQRPSNVPTSAAKPTVQCTKQTNSESVSSVSNLCLSSSVQMNGTVANPSEPKVVKLNSDAFIVPGANLFAVNGQPSNFLNCYNNAAPLLLNKPFALPTLILMQNNFVPVNTVQHIAVSQRTQKLILPKQTINTTKTTFINKKPIPSVRLYKAATSGGSRKTAMPRRRRSRRSKGILVKYPKRKPPTKSKKRELRAKKPSKLAKVDDKSENTDKAATFTQSAGEAAFVETSNSTTKYQCAEQMLNIAEIPTTGQLIDFFENTATRCLESTSNNASECSAQENLVPPSRHHSNQNDEPKGEKSQMSSFVANTFEHSFSSSSLSCALIESPKGGDKVIEATNQKTLTFEPPSTSNSLQYVPSDKNFTPINESAPDGALEKPADKEIAGLRPASKELNLSFDDKKHYESSFDEFSNDLFTSLTVPSSGHNDSISPTAAFLQTFPLVSSGPNADLLPEHDVTTTTSTTILQIGNLESPSNMLFPSKPAREAPKVASDVSTNFVYSMDVENGRKEKKSAGKEMPPQSMGFGDLTNFNNQPKTSCSKDVSQMSFYPTSTSTATFSSYFTKYNDFPPVTCSYYSLCSQPFTTTKTTDSGDFNSVQFNSSWMPSAYTQDESTKEKPKRDKCVNTFKSIQDIESYASDAAKSKKPKLNARPLVNWMTSDVCQSTDTFALPKEDTNSYISCQSSNNTNFNSYSDYYVENQNYSESQLTSCKLSSANPCSQWVPSKSTLPLPREANVIIPSTLPTLVGDLALSNSSTFNYDLTSKKFEPDKKKACRNYCKNVATPSSFLSVTQLVDDKSVDKAKKHLDVPMCSFGEQEKYAVNQRNDGEYSSKKSYAICKEKQHMKCKKDAKYQVPRCASKENKKDTRYAMQNCQVQKEVQNCQVQKEVQNCQVPKEVQSCQVQKEVNPLSSKNSNYSAESLIGSSNQNCSGTGYFPYENSNYGSCSNEYSKRNETESLANVGYYSNSNYVYHNNFQSFNNYGFSNQCYNNYSSQIQTSGFQKKKDEYNAKPDAEWSLSYNSIVQSDFSNNQKVDPKCKQSFANKYNAQKNSSEMYKYYQASSAQSTLTQAKSNCAFNSTCSFNQPEGQACVETNYLAPNYEVKSSRNSNVMNTNTVQSATTLTNFNLSTIFPEINDKHCSTTQVNAVNNEKNDPKYGKNIVDEANFNYFLQPAVENSTDHFFGSSSTFQIHNFTDFTSRKTLK